MADYVHVNPSQVHLFRTVPLYYKTQDQAFVLYKREGDQLDRSRAEETKHPDLYIDPQDKKTALGELGRNLNMALVKTIAKCGLVEIKTALCRIVEEALTPGQEALMDSLPQTLDILLSQFGKNNNALEYLAGIAANSKLLVEHTVNVTALTLQYGLFHKLEDGVIRNLGLAAFLHDVGFARLDPALVETRERLTNKAYKLYQSHTYMGHDMLEDNDNFGNEIARTALEHHERIDGSGYPTGTTTLLEESQLIGLIDSYESLTYRDKTFRKAQKPFSSLSLIKEEVLDGRFDKGLFKGFASCLVR